MQTVHIEDTGHEIVVSMTDTVIARIDTLDSWRNEDAAMIVGIVTVLQGLGYNVEVE